MALDRGTLSRIDRRVFAELAHTAGVQAVKVPVSDAVWSAWRRYCEAVGLSMGEGVAGLIAHELETVVGDDGDASDVFAEQVARQVGERAPPSFVVVRRGYRVPAPGHRAGMPAPPPGERPGRRRRHPRRPRR